jgi:RNA polymerase sigma-70 factor (ECF subfamily)
MRHDSHEPGVGEGRPSTSSTSRSLLERVRADDPEAWDRLVALYAPLVLHWCQRLGLARQDVADVFQEVFRAVAGHIRGFHKDQPGDTFRGWLRTITRNKVHDHYRRLHHEPAGVGGSEAQARLLAIPSPGLGEESDAPGSDEEAERGLLRRALEMIRDEFEERTWQAFWRTTVDGQLPRDVATELGMSPGAVRVAKCRVLHRLREELGDVLG